MTMPTHDPDSTRPMGPHQRRQNRRHLLIGGLIGVAVAVILTIVLGSTRFTRAGGDVQPTIIMIMPDFTETPVPTQLAVDAPGEEEPDQESRQDGQQSFPLGQWVQVTGTEGVGLNLRNQAGLDSPVVLVALDNEIFEVRGGPVDLADVRWWYLVNPYDDAQSGWADDRFLETVDE